MPVIQKSPPELRFPEFSGAWNHGVLGDCIESLNAGVSVLSSDIPTSKGQKRILKTSCVSSGFFDPSENKLVDDAGQIKRLKEHVCRETIVISRMNTPELVGANAYVQNTDKSLFLPDRLWAAKIDLKYSSRWIAILLSGPKLRATLSARATGTSNSMKNISKADVKSIRIYYPSKEEQQKIASFLSSVDTKIKQLNKKKALLEQYKKGMMQKLFSQEIRFKDEQERGYPDWVMLSIEKIATVIMGTSPKSTAYNQNSEGLPLIQGNSDVKNRKSDPRVYTTEITKECMPGDTLLSVRAPVGNVSCAVQHACIGRGIAAIRAKSSVAQVFLYNYLILYESEWKRISQGSTFGSVNSNDVRSIKVCFPSALEQQKIANFLSAIDKKIELVAEQLKQAKTFKKGLLQQMFI